MFSLTPFLYFEKQQGRLCGQHCLNNLLQGFYFSANDLATIAQMLDRKEQSLHSISESGNMDETGFFSLQVLEVALNNFGLSMELCKIDNSYSFHQAYIVNEREHWYAIRKFGKDYYMLNSLLDSPKVVDLRDYLSKEYLFAIGGQFPLCQADAELEKEAILDELANRPLDHDEIRRQRLQRFK